MLQEATGETAMHYLFDRTPIEPVQVFDNLFYIGTISVAQFIVRTSEGLIMIDSGWDEQDADYAAASMKKLGLSPADTRYILLTHGHSDHYGGAQFFKDKYAPQAKVGINIIDSNWYSVIPAENAFADMRPQIDIELNDRRPGQPHPFVIGQEKYRQYEDVFRKMAQDAIGKYQK
ncbi:MBL fold metallo-hydrolase [Selenomonas ruminantium]|uniref:Metallo-beta-lactamase superfamily protein n=1 Tax=Selenomonas ruminantium TaxID=971 RepID=A0A1H0NB08_SELRU|nr:MBL fold metallo-hydrolase [Selenomonas ruminantium]SDO89934.1 Metallo-beta-lactamase superfamily protein [Selenomonas ruminantium]